MLRRTLRRLRLTLFALITTAIIALAVLMGLTQLAMPWLVHNPARIEAWLSERLHQPVTVGGITGAWVGGGPVLALEHVRIGNSAGTAPLEIPKAELALSAYAPFGRGLAWSECRGVCVAVGLAGGDDVSGHLKGLDVGAAPTSSPQELSMGVLGVLVLKD